MARYIDADKIVDIIKTDIKQCEIDVSESCGDEFYEMAVNSRSNAMYSILREIEGSPTADVVPKSEVEALQREIARLEKALRNSLPSYCQVMAEKQMMEIGKAYGRREVAREIFELVECAFSPALVYEGHTVKAYIAELKKKYTEGENEDQRGSN